MAEIKRKNRYPRNEYISLGDGSFNHLREIALALRNSACRASACTGTAVDALRSINLELTVAHADRTNRALSLTSTTSYTSVTDYECHDYILLML